MNSGVYILPQCCFSPLPWLWFWFFFPCEEFLPLLYYLFPLLPSFTLFLTTFPSFSLFTYFYFTPVTIIFFFFLYIAFFPTSLLFSHISAFLSSFTFFSPFYPLSLYFTGWFFSLSKFWVEYIPPVYDLLLDMNCLMLPAGIPRGGVSGYPPF